ncbi:MAG TPA: hypothetical protein VFG49_15745 [Dyella sp.]|uniref:hypothetical protein n=1 Tax=Dyella sp. TaxID=1869338 RepID=UPI002D76FE6A|nr:hypothetical protein [Dyella sp.]HET6554980.1 hypothetical protein [Dyella sp.]
MKSPIADGRAIDQANARFNRTFASQGDVFDASFVGLAGLNARLSAHMSMMFG